MATPAYTLTGTLQDLTGTANVGSVQFQLVGFGTTAPHVAGTNMLVQILQTATANNSGLFTITLFGNDVIAPSNTYYVVSFISNTGVTVLSVPYLFTGSGTFDISNLIPMGSPLAPAAPTAVLPSPFTPIAGSFLTGMNSAGTFSSAPGVLKSPVGDQTISSGNLTLAAGNLTITAGTLTATSVATTGSATAGTQFLGSGSLSAPTHSFTAETNSGWFRQQAGILGLSIASNYITQYSPIRVGHAPGVSIGWAPGVPNSFADDINLSRISAGVLGVGSGSAGSTAGTLNAANLTASGTITSATVNASVAVTAKTLNSVQNVAKYATGGAGTSVSPWTSASGTGGCQEAVNALGANGGNVLFTEGFYSFTNTTTGCVAAGSVTFDSVGRSAIIQAGANNAVFFSDSISAFFSRFLNLTLDGNAFTGVKAFDLTNARYGSVIQNVNLNNLNQGIVSTNGNFGMTVKNVSFRAVTAPISVVANSSSVLFDYVTIDNENFVPTVACTNGMNFQSGTLSNLGPTVLGGFIQGCATGILDQTVGLTVIGTYFEDSTVADISCSGAFNPHYIHTNHWGSTGPVAIKGRTCTGAFIDNPIMGSGARTNMLDWDSTNTQSMAEYIINGSSMNTPVGTTAGLAGLKTGSKILTGDLQLRRPLVTQGTLLTTPKVVPNAQMGSTATITSVRGTDAAFSVQINSSGTGQAVNGGFTVTFSDGAWTNIPICTLARTDGGSPAGNWFIPSSLITTTTMVVDLNGGVPVAGNTYGVSVICVGSPN